MLSDFYVIVQQVVPQEGPKYRLRLSVFFLYFLVLDFAVFLTFSGDHAYVHIPGSLCSSRYPFSGCIQDNNNYMQINFYYAI